MIRRTHVVGALVAVAALVGGAVSGQGINLARFQNTTADSSAPGVQPEEATDGIVSNESQWYSNGDAPEWLRIDLPESFTIGSAHLYLGNDDSDTIDEFALQVANGGGWITITNITGNTATDLNVIFPAPVVANQFRLHADRDVIRIKEIALFPPNGGAGYPLGTDVNLNLASQRAPVASSVAGANYSHHAVDGHVDNTSSWLSDSSAGPHTLEVVLPAVHRVGSVHLHHGSGGSTYLAEFSLDYYDGAAWQPVAIRGVSVGTFSGNVIRNAYADAVAITLFTPVSTDRVRLQFTQPSGQVRELLVLPANVTNTGSLGYPLGAGVKVAPRPTASFTDYHDAWYQVVLRGSHPPLVVDAAGARLAEAGEGEDERGYQLLYSYALDAYRMINRANGLCLQVADASQAAGAAIEEGAYEAAPHQLWRLLPVSDGYHQVQNVWSGHVLTSSAASAPAAITQESLAAGSVPITQQWKALFLDDLFKKGHGGWVGSWGSQWGYDWGRAGSISGLNRFYAPMQHNQGWPPLATLHTFYPRWNDDAVPTYLLGFNEPDKPAQANMTVAAALDLWPRLEAMDLPLLSPACAQGGEDWWLTPFMDDLDTAGYRCDYAGGHWYSNPNLGNLINHINDIGGDGNGRDVWLTEFSVVDWSGGSGTWSEEDNYHFILEFLWRAEDLAQLRKYALFIFEGGVPTHPWDKTNPRSNFRNGGGLHAFGKAYAAWDGDRTIHDRQPYLLHNRAAASRLANGGGGLTAATIRVEDATCQWMFEDAGDGKTYITSLVDGRRLRYNGTALDYAPLGSDGRSVEWTYQLEAHGWYNLYHPVSGQYLRLTRTSTAPLTFSFEMHASIAGLTSTDWFLVKPDQPVEIPVPAAPVGLRGMYDGTDVQLQWIAHSEPVAQYRVYRSLDGGLTRHLLADEVTGAGPLIDFTDSNVVVGVDHTYDIAAVSPLGIESAPSSSVTVPVPLPDPNAEYGTWAGLHFSGMSGVDTSFTGDVDLDGIRNGAEYAFLTEPVVSNRSPLAVSVGTGGTVRVHFPWNAVETDIDWSIEYTTDYLPGWPAAGVGSEESLLNSNVYDMTVAPTGTFDDAAAFRLRIHQTE